MGQLSDGGADRLAVLWHRHSDVYSQPSASAFEPRYAEHEGNVSIDTGEVVAEEAPMIDPPRDVDFFRQVHLEERAPACPNSFEVAPGWLYREIAQAGQLRRSAVA